MGARPFALHVVLEEASQIAWIRRHLGHELVDTDWHQLVKDIAILRGHAALLAEACDQLLKDV